MLNSDLIPFIKWMQKGHRYVGEASSRWGHIYEHARDAGLVCLGPLEVFMNGPYRDVRRAVYTTVEGRKLLQ